MALPIFQVDYSPVYSALNSLRGAKTTEMEERHRKQDTTFGIIGFAVEGANMLIQAINGAQMAKLKGKLTAFHQEAQQKARDAILNNEYEIVDITPQEPDREMVPFKSAPPQEPKRTWKFTGDFDTWYAAEQKKIEDQFKGFPKIKSWAFDQMYSIYDTAKRTATDTLFKKSMQETATIESEQITNSIDQAIRSGNFKIVEAAIGGARSLSPDVKTALLADSRRQFNLGVQGRQLRDTVGAQGYAAGMDLISGWETAGQVNAEQADNFRKQAAGDAATATSVFATKASKEAYDAVAQGRDSESAMEAAIIKTPPAYRQQVDKLVRAEHEERMRQQDNKADKEMLVVNNQSPQDGATLLNALYNPENQYAQKMSTNTYTFWENYGNRLLAAAGREGGEGDGTTKAGQSVLNEIMRNPYLTSRQKINEIQKASRLRDQNTGEFLIGPSTLNKYLNYANSGLYDKTEVRDGAERINKWFDRAEQKSDRDLTVTRQQALDAYDEALKVVYQATQPPKATTIEDIVDRVLQPHKSILPVSDDVGDMGRRTRTYRLMSEAAERAINPDESAWLADSLEQSLRELYGVGTGSIQIAGRSKDERNRPIFSITGLNPEDPRTPYTYRFQVTRGGLQLQGEIPTTDPTQSSWIDLPIKSKQQIAAEIQETKRQETLAKNEAIRAAGARVRTIEQVKTEAARLNTTRERLAFEAIGSELQTNPMEALSRLEAELPRQFRSKQATMADVRRAAGKAGISEAAAWGLMRQQGINILE